MVKAGTVAVGVCEGSGVGYGVLVNTTVGVDVLVADGVIVGDSVGATVCVEILVGGIMSVAEGVKVGGLAIEILIEAVSTSHPW